MTSIKKRITVTTNGTPESLDALSTLLPDGVPANAVIVSVNLRTESRSHYLAITEDITRSHLTLTLEWPA